MSEQIKMFCNDLDFGVAQSVQPYGPDKRFIALLLSFLIFFFLFTHENELT